MFCVLLKLESIPSHEAGVPAADTFHASRTPRTFHLCHTIPNLITPHTWSLKEAGLTEVLDL